MWDCSCIQVTWKCDHCNQIVFKGGQFRAANARVHLAAYKSNGLCSNLCTADDANAEKRRKHFRKVIEELNEKKIEKSRKRKQQVQRLETRETSAVADTTAKKRSKRKGKNTRWQPKLKSFLKVQNNAAADVAVAQWAIAHDISPNAMKGPYWKQMNRKLAETGPCYKPMYDRKLFEKLLPQLRTMAENEVNDYLKYRKTIGRTLTGDGATKGVPLINFLVHVAGKGVKLLSIVDCSKHLSSGGIKDAMYVLAPSIAIHFYNALCIKFNCLLCS